MHEGNEPRSTADRRHSGHDVRASDMPVPQIVRRLTTQFGWRHVQGIALIRFLVAVWLVCLGSIFLAFGQWWAVSLYVVAALVGALAYLMPRWKLALDGEHRTQTA